MERDFEKIKLFLRLLCVLKHEHFHQFQSPQLIMQQTDGFHLALSCPWQGLLNSGLALHSHTQVWDDEQAISWEAAVIGVFPTGPSSTPAHGCALLPQISGHWALPTHLKWNEFFSKTIGEMFDVWPASEVWLLSIRFFFPLNSQKHLNKHGVQNSESGPSSPPNSAAQCRC